MNNSIRNLRWALTVLLLVFISMHVHWSVALFATFVSISIEGLSEALAILAKALQAHIQQSKNHDNE